MRSRITVSMKTLSTDERARILHLLCEGTSIRAVCRLTGASKNTVAKLLGDVGRVCMAYHDEHIRGLKSKRIQVDEAWAFIYAKQKNVGGEGRPRRSWRRMDLDRNGRRQQGRGLIFCRRP